MPLWLALIILAVIGLCFVFAAFVLAGRADDESDRMRNLSAEWEVIPSDGAWPAVGVQRMIRGGE